MAASTDLSAAAQMVLQKGFVTRLSESFGQIQIAVQEVLEALPLVPKELLQALGEIIKSAPSMPLLALTVCYALGLIALQFFLPIGLRWILTSASPRKDILHHEKTETADEAKTHRPPTARAYFIMAFHELLDRILCLILIVVFNHFLFDRKLYCGAFALACVEGAFRYRLIMMARDILFCPRNPALALFSVPTPVLRALLPPAELAIALSLGFIFVIPVLLDAHMLWTAGQAFALVTITLATALVFVGVLRARKILRQELQSGAARTHVSAIAATGQDYVRAFALVRFTMVVAPLVWLAWVYGVVALNFTFYEMCVNIGTLCVVGIVLLRLIGKMFAALHCEMPALGANNGSSFIGLTEHALPARDGDALSKAVSILTALRASAYALGLFSAAWILSSYAIEDWSDFFGIVQPATLKNAIFSAAIALLLGYLAYVWLHAIIYMHFGIREGAFHPGNEELVPASRLSTIMPLVQGFAGFIILGSSLIYALSALGVNTAPLLAGAGIFGLAISFGSQALVRDIVAGLFYMIDDAFRIGEYIEAGRLKGTVEKISLRSLRLRHQNGQLHTVPFGQLGSVTNHSRDWLTVKFNLRLMRDSDFELVRKTVKRIGEAMLEDPELGQEFLQPLKLQGIADVQENATLFRFKFTVRPGKPTLVQRAALKRIVEAFAQKGIMFASNAVIVSRQTSDFTETREEEEIAGAAASAGLAQAQGVRQSGLLADAEDAARV